MGGIFLLPFFSLSDCIITQARGNVKTFLKNLDIFFGSEADVVEATALVVNLLPHLLALDNQTIDSGVKLGGLGLGFFPSLAESLGINELKTRNLINKLFSHFFFLLFFISWPYYSIDRTVCQVFFYKKEEIF
jgi:hypothetical protein